MRKVFILLGLLFIPAITYGSTASDFKVNNQSTYSIPPGTTGLLILDLTLPEAREGISNRLESIKIYNAGTAIQDHISKIILWEDGPSAGWDGDENKMGIVSSAPFWEFSISGFFSEYNYPSGTNPPQRIFITVDIASAVASGKTIQPKLAVGSVTFSDPALNGPTDTDVIGLERTIVAGTSLPTVPVTPMAKNSEAISSYIIRWQFADLSNNEFGFKILDSNLNEVARQEEADISYIDEVGLQPNTEYSGRKVVAFNDRGESLSSNLSVFSSVRTLPAEQKSEKIQEEVQEKPEEEVVEEFKEVGEELNPFEDLQQKIAEIQQKINEFFEKLTDFINQQTAIIYQGFQQFLLSLFGN